MGNNSKANSENRRRFLKTTGFNSLKAFIGLSLLPDFGYKLDPSKMPRRILGRTNMSVSLLGFGAAHNKDKTVYPRAIELGINTFRVAGPDSPIGFISYEALLPFREKIHLAFTSLNVSNATHSFYLEDLDNFLKQSKMKYVDIWYIAVPDPDVLIEFSEAVNIARKAGKILWSGISTHNVKRDSVRLLSPDSPIDVVMMTYNYLSPKCDSDFLNQFHQAGLGIMPMKPLAGNFLKKPVDRPDPLIRWLAADERIHTITVMMNSIEQLEQNVSALQLPFSEEDQKLLQNLYSYNSSRFCRMCGTCEGRCPNGLNVADLVRISMYREGYHDEKLARFNLSLIPERNRQIICDKCDQCVINCPNGVAIQKQIGLIKDWLS
ncbi:MAG: aldo/keto reductase [Bacteroidales bacterium]|nr:aldo/keto reductase [Bacteroidales bacterium]